MIKWGKASPKIAYKEGPTWFLMLQATIHPFSPSYTRAHFSVRILALPSSLPSKITVRVRYPRERDLCVTTFRFSSSLLPMDEQKTKLVKDELETVEKHSLLVKDLYETDAAIKQFAFDTLWNFKKIPQVHTFLVDVAAKKTFSLQSLAMKARVARVDSLVSQTETQMLLEDLIFVNSHLCLHERRVDVMRDKILLGLKDRKYPYLHGLLDDQSCRIEGGGVCYTCDFKQLGGHEDHALIHQVDSFGNFRNIYIVKDIVHNTIDSEAVQLLLDVLAVSEVAEEYEFELPYVVEHLRAFEIEIGSQLVRHENVIEELSIFEYPYKRIGEKEEGGGKDVEAKTLPNVPVDVENVVDHELPICPVKGRWTLADIQTFVEGIEKESKGKLKLISEKYFGKTRTKKSLEMLLDRLDRATPEQMAAAGMAEDLVNRVILVKNMGADQTLDGVAGVGNDRWTAQEVTNFIDGCNDFGSDNIHKIQEVYFNGKNGRTWRSLKALKRKRNLLKRQGLVV
ncbi:unnamed protein product [Linum tenue]|uniref:Myb-like domain-containing protein n=1 Tax=Linum tenue TaxID=586396 RepID=A0AAV0IQ49_9ROSI|nr:unnamed protein product [Linum tenue]